MWRPELTTLLDRLLAFLPSMRVSAGEALALPYFADWHDPDEEPLYEHSIDWSFDLKELTMLDIRKAIYKECITKGTSSSKDGSSPSISGRSLVKSSTGLTEIPPPPAFLTGQSMED